MTIEKRIEALESRATAAKFPDFCYSFGTFDPDVLLVLPRDAGKLAELETFLSANPGEAEKLLITKIFTCEKHFGGV